MNTYLLCIIALIPISWLMISLGVLRQPAHKTCTITMALTFILAIVFWKMPFLSAVTAAIEGVAIGLSCKHFRCHSRKDDLTTEYCSSHFCNRFDRF